MRKVEMTERPLATRGSGAEAVEEFVGGLQTAIDASDADVFNRRFTRDVLWGSPFGAVVAGYDEIHSIHSKMFGAARARQARGEGGGSRYEIEHARLVADDVAIAYVRRLSLAE
jgi:ketosteroid isomerase-like protein